MNRFLVILILTIPITLFCQKFSGELIISMVDSSEIDGYVGDVIVEIIDGVESATQVGPKDIGRKRERHRDTIKYIYTKKEVISFSSFSNSFEKPSFRHFDFKEMKSYNYKLDVDKYKEIASFRMFEDFYDYRGNISEFKIDKEKTKQIAGFEGFWIEYFIINEKEKIKIKGYVTESIKFPLPLLSPKEERLSYIPLSVSIEQFYLLENFQRKTNLRLISHRKISKRKVKRLVRNYKQKIN